MNYAPYLGAIRGEHVRAAARSIGAALIEQPGLEASAFVRGGGKLRDGMRGPDFRFGAHETRVEQPPDDHPCLRGIEFSWGFARGVRAAPLSLTSRTYKEQRSSAFGVRMAAGTSRLIYLAFRALRTHLLA